MNDEQFDELLTSVINMTMHMRGESIDARVREFPESDVKTIREKTEDHLSMES
jgi:hypothetical protein